MIPDTSGRATKDVIDILIDQHEQLKVWMAQVANPAAADRAEAFEAVAELLEHHEHGEQKVIHAATRHAAQAGQLAGERMEEEQHASKALNELRKLGVDAPEFPGKFADFRDAVLEHAQHEEQEEFPLLRRAIDGETLVRMARDLRAAEGL